MLTAAYGQGKKRGIAASGLKRSLLVFRLSDAKKAAKQLYLRR